MDERLLWRGTNTGIWHAPDTRWREAQRARAVVWAGAGAGGGGGGGWWGGGNVLVLKAGREDERVGRGERVRWVKWTPAMADVAFAGVPGSCAPGVCEKLERVFEWRRPQDLITAGNYKYVLDVCYNLSLITNPTRSC